MEMNIAMRYKLRMMGILIHDPTNTFADNKSVVTNITIPESTLQKRHNAIAYHKCREECAAGAARVAYEKGAQNCSDGLTKNLDGPDFCQFVTRVLY
jgi:hypothetical protein